MQNEVSIETKPILRVFKDMLEFVWGTFLALVFIAVMPIVGYALSQKHSDLTFIFVGLAPTLLIMGIIAKDAKLLRYLDNPFGQSDRKGGATSYLLGIMNTAIVLTAWGCLTLKAFIS